MTFQWIDRAAGLAYVCVRGRMSAFAEFLDSIDALITHPNWHPGMPIVEDIRDVDPIPVRNSVEEWRAFVTARGHLLKGCRWAVVRRGEHRALIDVLDTAAGDAALSDVTLRQFSNTVDAHVWVSETSVHAARSPSMCLT